MRRLEVRYQTEASEYQIVGVLAEEKHQLFFEYTPSFLESQLWLSPFKLPLKAGVFQHKEPHFGPLFGLFDDSLPDGWGMLLMDRYLRGKGVLPSSISPLDRLAYLGHRTMGALTYFPPEKTEGIEKTLLDLHRLSEESKQILEGNATELLSQLFQLGGSPGGARPKILVGVQGDSVYSGGDELPDGYRHWLIKFHGRTDGEDSGVIELAYAEMAREAKIIMPETRLFETKEGERFFGIERFDREGKKRYHIHSFGNLIHANFRIPSCDYGQFLEVTQILTKSEQDIRQSFRRMVFNVATHNRDDHVKNFAFRLEGRRWRLAPAFDLTYAEGPGGEHSMSVDGEGRAPTKKHFLALASRVSIPQEEAEEIIEEICEAVSLWKKIAASVGITKKRSKQVAQKIEASLKAIQRGS